MSYARDLPILINCRDQVSMLRELVNWLLEAGHERLYLIDNASTFEPLLDYFSEVQSRIAVVRLAENVGHLALWQWNLLDRLGLKPPFVYADPDMVPIEECPHDLVQHLLDVMLALPRIRKVGVGIVIDDLPEHYQFRDQVQSWESQYWQKPLMPGVFEAAVDTTFAIYRDAGPFTLEAVRTGYPYVMRHLPWYVVSDTPSEELLYYRAHAKSASTTWSGVELPFLIQQVVRRQASSTGE